MSGLGLQNTLRKRLLEPFWAYRGDETTNKPGVPIGLIEFNEKRPDGGEILRNAAGEPIGWNDIFREMGQGPYETYLNALVARSDDFQFLVGPLIEEMVIKGYAEAEDGALSWWRRLCAETGVPAVNEAIKKPYMKWQGEPKFTGEGEDLPVVTIKHGEESLAWKKKGVMIQFTLEYLMANPIPVMSAFLAEMGAIMQYQECQHVVQTLINGDIATGANAAPVIGIADTGTGLQYTDFLTLWTKGGVLGRRWFTLITDEATGKVLEELDEFKKREMGGALINLQAVNRPMPQSMDHFITGEMSESTVMPVDNGRTVRQRVFLPLHVEGARRPENLTQVVSVATSTTYEIIDDMGRVSMDLTKAFATYGWPDWFKLGGSRL